MERTFIMIKPDHVGLANKILEELDGLGERATSVKVEGVPREVIQEHYAGHKGKPYFGYMTESFVGRDVVIAIYSGDGVIQKMIDAIGATDPVKAAVGTIRREYGHDSLEKAIIEGRPVRNVVHRSDSVKEAEREIEVWKDYFNCQDFSQYILSCSSGQPT